MNENKQIEEMARIIRETCRRVDESGKPIGFKCLTCDWFDNKESVCKSNFYKEGTELYNAGYRNVKDKVVLSTEDLKQMVRARRKCVDNTAITTRKKTAREIFEKIREKLKGCPEVIEESYDLQNDDEYFLNIEGYNKEFTNEIIEDLAKQYGVEVEDESKM